ncbi:unnamed protein product [Protopolystoma xenopodis]|uniref:PHD-type domain-containing protein n=1 Tax=Protopolystoma xenopodis TaxID=117903 RepID=A0A3S4ZVY1_9PLAT|nr:unnamed protein product [Protopolystoma xenopodis]
MLKTEIKIDEHNCRSDEPILKANVCVTTSVEGVLPTEPSEITSVKRENGHSLKETIDGEKHDTPSIDNPKLDDSIKEEHDFDLKKDRKRKGKRYEPTNVEQDLNFTPRRSGRQRKQVEFLTMEPIKPKSYSRSTIINEEECDKSRGKKRKASDEYGDDDNGEASLKEGKVKRRRKSLRDSEGKIKKKKKKRKIKKSGKVSGSAPWMRGTSSESSTSEEEDYFERVLLAIHDSDDEDPKPKHKIGKNDFEWNNQPESDFDPEGLDKESDVDSITQGRNLARQKRRQKGVKKKRMGSVEDEEELEEDKPCQICSRSHLPEWILLCDRCDLGHHAMCLFPPLFIIPEGEWFCPRCQHSALINSIANKITELQAERKAREHKQRMQERINFISISLTNILPSEQRAAKHKTRLYGSGNGSINGLDESTSDESRTISDRSSTVADSEGTTRKCRLRHRHENDSCDNDINETNSTSNDSSFSRIRRRARRTARSRAGSRLTTRQTRFNSCEDTGSGTETSNSLEALPLMRATRRRSIRYDINDAFKQIDEALEGDEKYQSQKRRRERRKERRSQGLPTDDSSEEEEEDDDGDVELGTTEGGKDGRRTGGRSRGKDLSNILGPDWKDDDAERRRRRRRLGDSLSQSSESEAAFGGRKGSDGNQTMDKRARPRKGSDGDDDDDFQPSEASNSSSRTQDDESAGSIEEEFSSGSIASDDSWRHELSSKKRSGRKPSWRHRNNKYSMSSFNKKRFQKFDGSDIDAEAGRNSRILPSR